MCGNRVEELEARVKELEASVEGLTDELVECKVRLRELESAVDEDIGLAPESTQQDESATEAVDTQPTSEGAVADSTKQAGGNDENNREESEAESDSDIIVA
jgi:predicted RNase H-like nuclease (RuvC/YqgF family)